MKALNDKFWTTRFFIPMMFDDMKLEARVEYLSWKMKMRKKSFKVSNYWLTCVSLLTQIKLLKTKQDKTKILN